MSDNKNDNRLLLFLGLIIGVVAFIGGFHCGKTEKTDGQRADTVVVERWDTVTIDRPTEIVRYVTRRDTVFSTDTAIKIIFDSVTGGSAAIIPIESAVYRDSTENAKYEAYLSGYRATLDSIQIECMNKETTITIKEPPRRIGVGVQLGVGFSAQGVAAPYIGIGVHYRLW